MGLRCQKQSIVDAGAFYADLRWTYAWNFFNTIDPRPTFLRGVLLDSGRAKSAARRSPLGACSSATLDVPGGRNSFATSTQNQKLLGVHESKSMLWGIAAFFGTALERPLVSGIGGDERMLYHDLQSLRIFLAARRPRRQLSIWMSPQIDSAWPEMVRPRGEQMNRIWSASCCGVTMVFIDT